MNSQKVSPKSRSSSFWTVTSSFSFRYPISPWGDFQLTPKGRNLLKDASEILQYLTPLPWGQQAFKDLHVQNSPQRAKAKAKMDLEDLDQGHSYVADRLPVVVRFPAGPRKTQDRQRARKKKDQGHSHQMAVSAVRSWISQVQERLLSAKAVLPLQPLRQEGLGRRFTSAKFRCSIICRIFCGVRVPISCVYAGFSVLSIDKKAVVPMITLDFTTSSGQAILWDILQSPNHWGSTRDPLPLRSAMFPLALPNLSNTTAKVDSANLLYKQAMR